jgi:hypothetical protein
VGLGDGVSNNLKTEFQDAVYKEFKDKEGVNVSLQIIALWALKFGLERAAKVAETITFEVEDNKPKRTRRIKPLWGGETAKAIRNLAGGL